MTEPCPTCGIRALFAPSVPHAGGVGELVEALTRVRDGLQAMADEGIIAQGSWSYIEAALAKYATQSAEGQS